MLAGGERNEGRRELGTERRSLQDELSIYNSSRLEQTIPKPPAHSWVCLPHAACIMVQNDRLKMVVLPPPLPSMSHRRPPARVFRPRQKGQEERASQSEPDLTRRDESMGENLVHEKKRKPPGTFLFGQTPPSNEPVCGGQDVCPTHQLRRLLGLSQIWRRPGQSPVNSTRPPIERGAYASRLTTSWKQG